MEEGADSGLSRSVQWEGCFAQEWLLQPSPAAFHSCPVLNSTVTLWQLKLTESTYNLNYRKSPKDLWSHFSVSLQNII